MLPFVNALARRQNRSRTADLAFTLGYAMGATPVLTSINPLERFDGGAPRAHVTID
jgi:hypothetical protein